MFNMSRTPVLVGLSFLLLTPDSLFAQVHGTVTDRDGKPLSGVTVSSGTDQSQSDDAGNFSLNKGNVIGLSKSGYRPVTRLSEDIRSNPVVVMDSPTEVWRAPKCGAQDYRASQRNGFRAMAGRHMRFAVPATARVRRVSDIDYSANVICTKGGECLQHGWGPTWSSGTLVGDLSVEFFSNVQQMTQREMYDLPNDIVWGEEYRGERIDGTRFRYVGVVNETVRYDGATTVAATLFDQIHR